MTECASCGTTVLEDGACPACGPTTEARARPRARVQAPTLTGRRGRAAAGASAPTLPDAPPSLAPATAADGKLSLVASIGLGLLAAVVAGSASAYITYATKSIWVYTGLVFGVIIGVGFQYRSRPETWRIRSILAAVVTLVSLFLSEYFLIRQLAIDELAAEGHTRASTHVPLFVSPGSMFRIVADYLHANPTSYLIWALTMYVAFTIPSANHRAAKKRAAARGQATP